MERAGAYHHSLVIALSIISSALSVLGRFPADVGMADFARRRQLLMRLDSAWRALETRPDARGARSRLRTRWSRSSRAASWTPPRPAGLQADSDRRFRAGRTSLNRARARRPGSARRLRREPSDSPLIDGPSLSTLPAASARFARPRSGRVASALSVDESNEARGVYARRGAATASRAPFWLPSGSGSRNRRDMFLARPWSSYTST